MQHLPDCKKRWADYEDTGTPSPWPTYALPDFNVKPMLWPDTPTPCDAICDPKTLPPPVLAQTFPAQAEASKNIESASTDLQAQAVERPCFAPAQTCPAQMLLPGATAPAGLSFQAPYITLVQTTCPATSEVPDVCAAGPVGLALQQNFAPFQDQALQELNEPVVMQPSPPWGCKVDDSSSSSTAGAYAIGMQWPSFTHPQSGVPLETLPQLEQWSNMAEDGNSGVRQEQKPSPQVDPASQPLSQKEMQHNSGQCRPCAWFWRERGCLNGDACGYCHLCPEGELKARKKTKVNAMRAGALTPVKGIGWGLKLDSLIVENP